MSEKPFFYQDPLPLAAEDHAGIESLFAQAMGQGLGSGPIPGESTNENDPGRARGTFQVVCRPGKDTSRAGDDQQTQQATNRSGKHR